MAYLYPYGCAIAAGLELAFQRAHEVADFFLVHVQVAVSGNAKLVAALDLQARKQALDVHPDDRRQEHEVVATRAAQVLRAIG